MFTYVIGSAKTQKRDSRRYWSTRRNKKLQLRSSDRPFVKSKNLSLIQPSRELTELTQALSIGILFASFNGKMASESLNLMTLTR